MNNSTGATKTAHTEVYGLTIALMRSLTAPGGFPLSLPIRFVGGVGTPIRVEDHCMRQCADWVEKEPFCDEQC